MKNYIFIETPLGKMTLAEENDYITNIAYGEITLEASCENETELLSQAKQQLAEYFNGERKEFNLPLKPSGTVFQLSVWKALTEIPYGKTASYKTIANKIHQPCAARAVGMANNKNPIVIAIPCHRVVGAKGIIKGYGGGVDKLKFLLKLENITDVEDFLIKW